MAKLCHWCLEPIPPLPKDASYVDEINHNTHDACRHERDDEPREGGTPGWHRRRFDRLDTRYVRIFVLERIKAQGFSRRCPCLYGSGCGFRGYDTHSFASHEDVDAYDVRNSVEGCELCGGRATMTRCRSSSS